MAGVSGSATTSPCRALEWDSEHFGFPIARVSGNALSEESAEAVDDWCRDHGIRCLYLCADAGDAKTARIAAAHGFRAVDVRVIARRPYAGLFELPAGPESFTVREATETDLAFARDLAARSHHTSRFYFDGNFPRDRCDALYRAWVQRGSRDPERRLLIGVVDGDPVGYLVAAPLGPDREGHGDLVAVDERHRGKGFGRALHFAGSQSFAERGALTHRAVMSFRSLAIIRLHEKLGFLTDEVQVWHHKWYGGG
jgi:dTDP-4-amino-4,6-dideoxy-D-galactose acyltransferase